METVKSCFSRARWKTLRLVLAVMLPLHAGLAQAAMVMAPHATVAVEAQSMADEMPCHHEASSAPTPDQPSPHQSGCCDAGACHCAAACAMAVIINRITPEPGISASPFPSLAVPAAAHPPDLRPPIG